MRHPCPRQRPSAPGLQGLAAAAVHPPPHAVSSISGPRARLQPEGERRFLLGFDPGSLRVSGRRPWLPAPPGYPQGKLRLLPSPEFRAIPEPARGRMDGPVLNHPGLLRVWPMHTASESTLSRGEPWKSGLPRSPFHELAAPKRSRLKPTRHLIVMTRRLRGVPRAASASQAAGAFARRQSPIGQEAPSSREWPQTASRALPHPLLGRSRKSSPPSSWEAAESPAKAVTVRTLHHLMSISGQSLTCGLV